MAQLNLRKALALDPAHPGAVFNLGICCFNRAEYPSALELFVRALEELRKARVSAGTVVPPSSMRSSAPPATRVIPATRLDDESRRGRRRRTGRSEEEVNLLTLIADCHERLQNPNLAKDFLNQALELDPKSRQAIRQLEQLDAKYGFLQDEREEQARRGPRGSRGPLGGVIEATGIAVTC